MDFEEIHNELIDAILSGCVDKTKLNQLVDNVKNPELFSWTATDRCVSPIGACIVSGNMELLDRFIARGAPLNIMFPNDGCGYSHLNPVEQAIKSQQPDILQRLLDAGAQCSHHKYVCRAMFYSDRKLRCFNVIMKYIVDKNLMPHAGWYYAENREFSPIHAALEYHYGKYRGWEAEAGDLEQHGKDENLVVDLVDVIIKSGFPLDIPVTSSMKLHSQLATKSYSYALTLAVWFQKCEAAKLLVKAGCDVNISDEHTLKDCIINRTFGLFYFLVHAGARVTKNHIHFVKKVLDCEIAYQPHDRSGRPSMEFINWMIEEECNAPSLKRLCRVRIRNYLRRITKGTNILPTIEQFEIPLYTKQYLALEIV